MKYLQSTFSSGANSDKFRKNFDSIFKSNKRSFDLTLDPEGIISKTHWANKCGFDVNLITREQLMTLNDNTKLYDVMNGSVVIVGDPKVDWKEDTDSGFILFGFKV